MAAERPTTSARLAGKTALVTGGGSGIGRATCVRFAAEGASVGVNDVNRSAAEQTVGDIAATGGKAWFVPGDVTAASDAEAMVQAMVEKAGQLDVLINNAGITRDGITVRIKDGEVKRMSEEAWDAVLGVNLKGTFLCCRAAAEQMIRQGSGHIVNTASISAFGNIGQANYSASKAGVIGLTKTLALELARYGVHVNCVAPGAVDTAMTEAIPERIKERLVSEIPLGRMARPEEIASAHLFLATDDSAYITGQCLVIDAGLSL